MEKEAIQVLRELLELEPLYVTHPLAIWNKARRLIVKYETGEVISEALSYNCATDTWQL